MEPEIARRCQSCGASVRGRAHFCPHCGRPMGDDGAGGDAGGDALGLPPAGAPAALATAKRHHLSDEAERVAHALSGKLSAAPERETPDAETAAAESTPAAEAERVPPLDGAGGEPREGESVAAGGGGPAARGAGVLGRAAAGVGARAGESLRPGVDRLRGTLVAFDEAASDDPGLRFVVVAGLLFLVFLLLWIISYVLG